MEYRNKVRCCLVFVKEHVKKSSTGYQQLAERLGVSVLTIKRQLNGDEISMSKLLALCDAAQVEFSEIWAKVENRKAEHNVFTKEQDYAFYYFPHLFRYFIELISNNSPSQIQEIWNISPASTHIYLRKLEELNLISLSEKANPTMLISEPMGFEGESLNVIKGIQKALIDVSDKLIAPREDEPFVIVKPMLLSEDLRHKMYKEIAELVSRYAELSERYFFSSTLPPCNLVICDYKVQDEEPFPDIIDITGFELSAK
jgi:transcriptional regulator with XRE-family HTH domain